PFVARLPDGIYRELVIGRIAETIKLTPERLAERWGAAPSEAVPATNRRPPKPARARISAGRGRLVTQAVRLLLHFPELAARVADHKQSGLVELDEPGARFLQGFIAELRLHPAHSTGQVLERWRDRPEG